MDDVLIRQECEDDYQHVYQVNEIAFQRKDEADLVNKLRHSSAFIPQLSLVATVNNCVVGYILFTKITIGNNSTISLGLPPLSVHSGYQHQGVGKQLIRKGLERAKELGYTSVIVLGHEHYYGKFGFIPARQWQIECPFPLEGNIDVFRAMELVPGALKQVSGMVHYSKEFYY